MRTQSYSDRGYNIHAGLEKRKPGASWEAKGAAGRPGEGRSQLEPPVSGAPQPESRRLGTVAALTLSAVGNHPKP